MMKLKNNRTCVELGIVMQAITEIILCTYDKNKLKTLHITTEIKNIEGETFILPTVHLEME